MKQAARRWAVPAVVLFLFFLLLTLPARQIWAWLSDGQLAAQDIQGTLWSGRAARVVHPIFSAGPIVWHIRPQALLLGRLEYQVFVQSDAGGGELHAGIGVFAGRYIEDVHLTQSAADVARRISNNMFALSGDFQFDLDQLQLSADGITALHGVVIWRDARVAQPSAMVLGHVQIQLALRDGRVVGTLGDEGGPLEVTGEVQIGMDRAYQLNIQLKPRSNADANLQQSLALLGAPDAQGRYHVQYSGMF